MSANDPMRTFGLAQQVKASWEGSGYHRQAFGRRTTVVVPLSVINSAAAPRVRMVLVLSMSKTAGTPPPGLPALRTSKATPPYSDALHLGSVKGANW